MDNTHATASGKTCPEHFRAQEKKTQERTSDASSKNLSKSSNRAPQCLRLLKVDGPTQTLTWEMDGALRTELSMRNIGESPSVVVASTLSQILLGDVPQEYYLSAKACEGILRRAERRGKALPEMLKAALEQQIERFSIEIPETDYRVEDV